MPAVWTHKGYPHPAEVSKGSLGRCVPVEKQRSRSSLSPLPGRSILPLLPALSSIKLRATGKPTFSSPSPKLGVNVQPRRRKQTLGLLLEQSPVQTKGFSPWEAGRFIYSITALYQHAGCPRRKGVISNIWRESLAELV